jgi:hypothetical protein
LRGELQAGGVPSQSLDQFIAHDLDDLLTRRERGRHLLADSFFLNALDELLYDFEVDVGFEQGQPDFAQSVLNVLFVEDSLPAQGLEGSLQLFRKILKHSLGIILAAANLVLAGSHEIQVVLAAPASDQAAAFELARFGVEGRILAIPDPRKPTGANHANR